MDRLPSQGQGDPEGLAGPEGEPEAPRLEVRALDDVDDADPDGDGAGGVDAGEVRRRHVLGRTRPEAEAAHREDDALLQEQHEGLVRRGGTVGGRHARGRSRKAAWPLVDVAADEELVRGAGLQVVDLGAVGPRGGLQVDLAPPRSPGRRWPGPRRAGPGATGPRGRRGTGVRGRGGRAWRRGRRRGPRPPRRPPARSTARPSPARPAASKWTARVSGSAPPASSSSRASRRCQAIRILRREPPRHRLADAVVIGLDLVGRIRAGAPDEVVRPQQGQRREPVGAQPGGAAGDRPGGSDGPPDEIASRSRRGSRGSSRMRLQSTSSREAVPAASRLSVSSPPSVR